MSEAPPHLLHVFATFAAAGPQVRTTALIDACGADYTHSVIAMDGRTEARERLADPDRVRLLEPPAVRGTVGVVRHFRALLRSSPPDLLLTYNWGAIEAALAARTLGLSRHLHHEDGFRPDEVLRPKARRNLLRRVALRRVHGLVMPSQRLYDIALAHWGLPAERVHLVPNGIRPEDFAPRDGNPALRSALGIPAGAPVVGYVGHLRAEKNPVRLIDAAAALDPTLGVHLLILGDGPERERVEGRAAVTGLTERAHLVGFREDPRPYYCAMDVFAISSDTEQMPVALLEAMAAHLPVASTDVGDVRSMLPAEQGELVTAAGHTAALTRSLGLLASDRDRRERLGAANRRRVEERYTFERMLGAYRSLYTAALASRGPQRV